MAAPPTELTTVTTSSLAPSEPSLNNGIISLELGVPWSGCKVVVIEPSNSESAHGGVMVVAEVIINDKILLGIVIGVDTAGRDALDFINGGGGIVASVGAEGGGREGGCVVIGGRQLSLVFNPDSERENWFPPRNHLTIGLSSVVTS